MPEPRATAWPVAVVLALLVSLLVASGGHSVEAAIAGEAGPGGRSSAFRHRFHALQFHAAGHPGNGVIYQAFLPNHTHGPSIRAVGSVNRTAVIVNGTGASSSTGGSRRLLQAGPPVPSYHFSFDTNFADSINGLQGSDEGGGSLYISSNAQFGSGSLSSPSTPNSLNGQESLVFGPSTSTYTSLSSRPDFTQAFWVFTPSSDTPTPSSTPSVFWETIDGAPIMSFSIWPSSYGDDQYGPLIAQIYLYCVQYQLMVDSESNLPWSSWVHVATRWTQSSQTFETLINGQVVYAGQVTADNAGPDPNACMDTSSAVTDAVWNPQNLNYGSSNTVAMPGLMDELWQFQQALTDDQVQTLITSNTISQEPDAPAWALCDCGEYQALDQGRYYCADCAPGTYTSCSFPCQFTTGCSICPAGNSCGAAQCGKPALPACGPGNFSFPGDAACRQCPPGYVSSGNQNAYCTLCPLNTYAVGGSSSCTSCPNGFVSNPGASACNTATIIPISYTLTDGSPTNQATFFVGFNGTANIARQITYANVTALEGTRVFCNLSNAQTSSCTNNTVSTLIKSGGLGDNLLSVPGWGVDSMGISYAVNGAFPVPGQSGLYNNLVFYNDTTGNVLEYYPTTGKGRDDIAKLFNRNSSTFNTAGGIMNAPTRWGYAGTNDGSQTDTGYTGTNDTSQTWAEFNLTANDDNILCRFGYTMVVRSTFRIRPGANIVSAIMTTWFGVPIMYPESFVGYGLPPIPVDAGTFSQVTVGLVNFCVVSGITFPRLLISDDCEFTGIGGNTLFMRCRCADAGSDFIRDTACGVYY